MYQKSSQSNGAILSTFPTGRQYLDNNGFPTAVNDTTTSGVTATYTYLQARAVALHTCILTLSRSC